MNWAIIGAFANTVVLAAYLAIAVTIGPWRSTRRAGSSAAVAPSFSFARVTGAGPSRPTSSSGRPAPSSLCRVLIAAGTADVRVVPRVLLELDGRFAVVGEAADGAQAVRLALAEQPDVIVMDLALPVHDGLEAIREIRERRPGVKIVVLSGHALHVSKDALALGAHTYFESGTDPVEIADTLAELCTAA